MAVAAAGGLGGGLLGAAAGDSMIAVAAGRADGIRDTTDILEALLEGLPALLGWLLAYGLAIVIGFVVGTLGGTWAALALARLDRRLESLVTTAALLLVTVPAGALLASVIEPLWPSAVIIGAISPAVGRYLAARPAAQTRSSANAIDPSP